jgi:hypothetical protein
MKSVVMCLLPGLDDESSEEFGRVLELLDKVKTLSKNVEDEAANHEASSFFWQCFFLSVITSPSRRQGALVYLVKRLPKFGESDALKSKEQSTSKSNTSAVLSPEPGLLVRCFVAGLRDEQILTQRGFLDLLVSHLPLDSYALQNLVKSTDLDILMTAAAGVVVRREISLNKRLWAWLLGPEPSAGTGSESQVTSPTEAQDLERLNESMAVSRQKYFSQFGLGPLTRGLHRLIDTSTENIADVILPYRISLSIMDQWEIGSLVVPEIFLKLLRNLMVFEGRYTQIEFNEIFRSATMFFDGVPSGLIWSELSGLLVSTLTKGGEKSIGGQDKLDLVSFVIRRFNIHEEEMLTVHIPFVVLALLILIRRNGDELASDKVTSTRLKGEQTRRIESSLNLAIALEGIIPDRAFLTEASAESSDRSQLNINDVGSESIMASLKKFYLENEGRYEKAPFSGRQVGSLLLRESTSLLNDSIISGIQQVNIKYSGSLVASLLTKVPKQEFLNVQTLFGNIKQKLASLDDGHSNLDFPTFTSLLSAITCLYHNTYLTERQLSDLIEPAVSQAWSYLSPTTPKYHVEAVRLLWQLQSTLPKQDRRIEAAICGLLNDQDIYGVFSSRSADAGRRFSVLWSHSLNLLTNQTEPSNSSLKPLGGLNPNTFKLYEPRDYEIMLTRPLFLLIDALQDEKTELFVFVRSFFQSLSSMDRVLAIVASKLLGSDLARPELQDSQAQIFSKARKYQDDDDLEDCLYYIQSLSNILQWSPLNTFAALRRQTLEDLDKASTVLAKTREYGLDDTLYVFLAKLCIRIINAEPETSDASLRSRLSKLHRTALFLLHQLISGPHAEALVDIELEKQLLDKLVVSVEFKDAIVQVALLDVCYAAIRLSHDHRSAELAEQHKRGSSKDLGSPRPNGEPTEKEPVIQPPPLPPQSFVRCLQAGLSSPQSRPALGAWVTFLAQCLPLFSTVIYQLLIPLVECICGQISLSFDQLKSVFRDTAHLDYNGTDSSILALLNGLEQVLGLAHHRLMEDQQKNPNLRSQEAQPGFLSNMVSGVFSSEAPQARSATANNRLTILLSFQDSVRICFSIWSWGAFGSNDSTQDSASRASFAYTSLRMRNRARRILENLFAAETLECLETIIGIWKGLAKDDQPSAENLKTLVFNLLNALDASRPKNTIPAIFNSIYSRTNPQALDAARKSALTTELADTEIVYFLVEYTRTLDDDAMDEIWADCLVFLRDVLGNPFPHRQTLPRLLEFISLLGEKVDNTNFGEHKKMRRELGVSLYDLKRIFRTDLLFIGSVCSSIDSDVYN